MTAPDPGGQAAAAPDTADLAARQQRLEDKVDSILSVLGKGERAAHAAAAEHEQDKLNRPSDVADEVRRQIEERDRAAAAAAEHDKDGRWRQEVNQSLAELREKPPEPPVRRVERFMGWR